MSKSLNRVSLLGNIGKDPEIRTTTNGNEVASLSVATTKSYKDKSGNWQDSTEWHKITAWGYLVNQIKKLSKGDKVYIDGELKTRSYEDKSGQKRYVTEVNAQSIIGLNNTNGAIDPQPNYDKFEDTDNSDFGDDIPF